MIVQLTMHFPLSYDGAREVVRLSSKCEEEYQRLHLTPKNSVQNMNISHSHTTCLVLLQRNLSDVHPSRLNTQRPSDPNSTYVLGRVAKEIPLVMAHPNISTPFTKSRRGRKRRAPSFRNKGGREGETIL